MSPDGKWMWNGSEWIPAPPSHDVVSQQSVEREMIQRVAESEQVDVNRLQQTAPYFDSNRDGVLQESEVRQAAQSIRVQPTEFIQPQQVVPQAMTQQPVIHRTVIQQSVSEPKTRVVPWVGVGVILFSLLLPYISVAGVFEVSGFDMVVEISDLMSEFDTSDSGGDGGFDDGSSDGADLSFEELALVVAIFLFLISPFFFILSAVISSIVLLSKKSPKAMGTLHLIYALLFVVSGIFSPSALGISIFDFIGIGFYMGAFASILLMIDS